MVRIPPSVPPKVPGTPPPPPEGEGKPKKIGDQPAPPSKGAPEELYRLDSQGIAARLAAYAREAGPSMADIVAMAIRETGILNPQAAMEEINKRIQEEINKTLEDIKENKELMEEAEAWESFANLLESKVSEEQIIGFLNLIGSAVKGISR